MVDDDVWILVREILHVHQGLYQMILGDAPKNLDESMFVQNDIMKIDTDDVLRSMTYIYV